MVSLKQFDTVNITKQNIRLIPLIKKPALISPKK